MCMLYIYTDVYIYIYIYNLKILWHQLDIRDLKNFQALHIPIFKWNMVLINLAIDIMHLDEKKI
jgi:hypothetical protein